MYLINCDKDDSYCIVDDTDVIYDDDNPPISGEKVLFHWQKSTYEGIIIMHSDDDEILKTELKKLRKLKQTSRKSASKTSSNYLTVLTDVHTKRTRTPIPKINFSPSLNTASKENTKKIRQSESFKQSEHRQAANKASQNLLQDIIENKRNPNKSIKINEKVSNDDEMAKQISGKLASFSKENVIKEGNPKSNKMLQKTITQSKILSASAKCFHVPSGSQSTLKLTESVSSKSIYKKNDSSSTETSDSERELVKNISSNTDSSLDDVENKESDKAEDEQKEDEKDPLEINEVNYVNVEDENGMVPNAQEDSQLFGKNWPDGPMVLLKYGVYCKLKTLNNSIGASCKASHLARRLMEGVFKPEVLLNATLTGQTARAQGKERQNQNVVCLDELGKNAIIDFARSHAKKKGWLKQSIRDIKISMSTRLGEIKRQHLVNARRDDV